MNSFQIALNAVAPMFCMLALGYYLRHSGFLAESALQQMNKLCFKVFLPVNVYYNIYKVDLAEVFNARLLLYAIACQFLILGLSLLAAILVEKEKKRRGALAHSIYHINFVIFGTLIGTALCGEGNIGSIMLLIAVIVPLQNVLSVVLLEYYREREGSGVDWKETLKSVVTNPYVISMVLGFGTQALRIHYPEYIGNVFRDLGRCGTPVALLAMGGLFNFGSVKSNLRTIAAGVVTRLVIVPAILLAITIAMGFRGNEFIALMCIFFAPCATSCFNLATQMDSDGDLTSQLIVFTSIGSLLTIFLWIWGLSSMGMF